jgi:hypothetical protein
LYQESAGSEGRWKAVEEMERAVREVWGEETAACTKQPV